MSSPTDLWNASPDALLDAMRAAKLSRGYLVTEPDGALRASHATFEPLAAAVRADRRDYHGHEGCFFEIGARSGHLLAAFVHRTRRGQAAGGVRFWSYESVEAFVRDGLRLSRGMGHKCALAGLWWGGGKGCIARRAGTDHRDGALRRAIYEDYGAFISGLRGCYVTAEDVGTTTQDMARIFARTRHTTCIPSTLGGSGNPSILTATGVVVAMETALEHLGLGTLLGKRVALQGLGNVSTYMIADLLERGVERIVGADIDGQAAAACRARHGSAIEAGRLELRTTEPGDAAILAEPCDVLAPNAVGAILNPRSIPTIRARIVCGGANNQLEQTARDAAALHARGILYVPDFLANRMGIVNCANEQYGVIDDDPAILAHLDRDNPASIRGRALEVFGRAAASGRTPAEEAERLADELAEQPHPLWGHRGRVIIEALVREGWDRGGGVDVQVGGAPAEGRMPAAFDEAIGKLKIGKSQRRSKPPSAPT